MSRKDPRSTNSSPISRLRMERGLTQAQLAELTGCTQKDISRWETGERNPSTKSLLKLAKVLGCPMENLL